MVLPIYVYGEPVLREPTTPVDADSPELQQFIDDMIETMHGASGIGLAAPQVGRTERLFVIDLSNLEEDLEEEFDGAENVPDWLREPVVFINPEVVEDEDCDEVEFEEGCLSIPDIREQVWRPELIHVRFLDRNFQPKEIEAGGMLARVIQHEFDHLNGVLFIDHISAFRRRLLKRRLREITLGEGRADYPLKTPADS